jgi:hypothetical protein
MANAECMIADDIANTVGTIVNRIHTYTGAVVFLHQEHWRGLASGTPVRHDLRKYLHPGH